MKYWIPLFLLFLVSCSGVDPSGGLDINTEGVEIAFPLVSSILTIPAVSEASNVDGNVEILPDGTVQVNYSGDVIEQNSLQIFPPFPGVLDIPILDTLFSVPLPIENQDLVDRAIVGRTKINFYFDTQTEDDISIYIELPQLTKDGIIFSRNYTINNKDGNNSSVASGEINIEDYLLQPDDNTLLFRYVALTSGGERIRLDDAKMGFDIFRFKYVEGKFGFRTFDVRGDIITIDLFNNWVSGGIAFLDPKVTLRVDNAFGLLTKSRVNTMDIITLDGQNLKLESILLDEGIDFAYPSFDEVGETKTTIVEFNSDNSNIKELFEQRASKVTYDIDALINSEDPDFIGFLTDTSFFRIKVDINLPIEGNVNELILEESTEVDLSGYEDVEELSIKLNAINGFPLDIGVQVYFLDINENLIDSLFIDEALIIPGAQVNTADIVVTPEILNQTEVVEEERIGPLLDTRIIKVRGQFDTGKYDRAVKLFDTYALNFNIGAQVKLK
jgi:hypothetical protein